MKTRPGHAALIVPVVLIVLVLMSWPVGAVSKPGVRAFATFLIDHGNQCTETTASVEVVDNRTSGPEDPSSQQSHVLFHYDVFGQPLSPGCDGLWYDFIDGAAPLGSGEFVVDPNRRFARLQKSMQVADDESGMRFPVMLDVSWMVEGAGEQGSVQATLSVTAPQIDPQYTINPLSPSTTAGIARMRDAFLLSLPRYPHRAHKVGHLTPSHPEVLPLFLALAQCHWDR